MRFINARIILDYGIKGGNVTVSDDTVTDISVNKYLRRARLRQAGILRETKQEGDIDLRGMYLAPGFVDIHCHGSGEYWFFDEPAKAAKWHLTEGTTSLLCSMWRNAGTYSYLKAIENVKAAMGEDSNIRGIHMEGPYVDPDLGSEGGKPWKIDPAEYNELLSAGEGIIKTWTFDPTQEGAEEFARAVHEKRIRLGVCYSKASPETLEKFLPLGLSIGSHIMCATGAPEPRFAGTKEPGSDVFVLTRDEMYAEVIADSLGGHVRPYNLKLIVKCKPGRIALVSDCCAGGDTLGSDVNIINGELYGSRLTLSVAIKNIMKHTNVGVFGAIRMATSIPAEAAGLSGICGRIQVGRKADFVILDEDLNVRGVVLNGKIVRKDFDF